MVRKEIPSTKWPECDHHIEAAIGRVIISWSVLEFEIDEAIGDVLRLDEDLAMCVTANLGFKSKLDIFRSALHPMEELWSVLELDKANCLISDTSSASDRYRNFVVHGQPWDINLSEGTKTFWGKMAARKGVTGKIMLFSSSSFDDIKTEIEHLVSRWNELRNQLASDIEFLNLVDRT